MGSFDIAAGTAAVFNSPFDSFTTASLKDLLSNPSKSSFHRIVNKLESAGVIEQTEKGKYLKTSGKVDDFILANTLYAPSYVSFESALNLHGILSQFPYEITSATVKKSQTKTIHDKTYSYTHIQTSLFWGYEKYQNELIATPEKSLIDQMYLAAKGIRSIPVDELDVTRINRKLFKSYLSKLPKNIELHSIIRFSRELKLC